jgi:XRE family aerobic/anaerobic benzoate catabolism transcriptional regulator
MAVAPVHDRLLGSLGAEVRRQRERLGWSRRQLAAESGLSERFLAQVETGTGNISVIRLAEVAAALGTSPVAMFTAAATPAHRPIALLGLRGAGKSTVGALLARRLAAPFVEIDQRIEAAAGLTLGQIFELHGERYYRMLERDVLASLLRQPASMVLATGGSIVSDPENFSLLRERCHTVWLKARPSDHWKRVIGQGDRRPMAKNPEAFAELKAMLAARSSFYARAELTVDTSHRDAEAVARQIASAIAGVTRT